MVGGNLLAQLALPGLAANDIDALSHLHSNHVRRLAQSANGTPGVLGALGSHFPGFELPKAR